MQDLGNQVLGYVIHHHSEIKDKKVFKSGDFASLEAKISSQLPLKGQDAAEVFSEVNTFINDHIAHTDHPRFFSFIPSPGNYLANLAEMLTSGYNVFAGHWFAGAAAGMIEKITLDWLCKIFRYPEGSGGIFTSGGSMANMTALATARNITLGEDFSKGVVYYSTQTHSSLSKGLRILGFRKAQMRPVSLTDDFRINITELKVRIEEDIEKGMVPCCIIGNAGTTNTGAVDDLKSLASIAGKHNMWFHIDGAYGAAAMLSEKYRYQLEGIELADSITLDPHKWWFQPYETGCLIVKDKHKLKQTFNVQAEYLDDTVRDEEEINFYDYGPQLTRSFRALKLYVYLRSKGIIALGKAITKGIEYAEYLESLFKQNAYWEIISPPSLGIIAFRLKISDDEIQNAGINRALSNYLLEDGYAMIITTKLKGKLVLRMCPIHPDLTKAELEEVVYRMNKFTQEYLQKSGLNR